MQNLKVFLWSRREWMQQNCSLTECFPLMLSYSITTFKPAVAGAWCAQVSVLVMSPWQSAQKWKMHPENLAHKPGTERKNSWCLAPRTCSCCKVFSSLNFQSSCDSYVLSNYVGKCYSFPVSRILMAYRGNSNDYRVWRKSSPCNPVWALHWRMYITLHDLPSKGHSCMMEFYGSYNLMRSPICEASYYSKEYILHTYNSVLSTVLWSRGNKVLFPASCWRKHWDMKCR